VLNKNAAGLDLGTGRELKIIIEFTGTFASFDQRGVLPQ